MHNFIKVKTKISLRGLKQARNKLIISTKQQKKWPFTQSNKSCLFYNQSRKVYNQKNRVSILKNNMHSLNITNTLRTLML